MYEDFTVALIIALAAVTTVAIYLGLFGMLGHLHVVECDTCHHHMTFHTGDAPRRPCSFCRHQRVLHPWRHGRAL